MDDDAWLNDDDDLQDKLFVLSGDPGRNPTADQYVLVAEALQHPRADVRERAIFIGGLRWMDKLFLDYFKDALVSDDRESDDNRRLMIEALVSNSLERSHDQGLEPLLKHIMRKADRSSLAAKAAYVGIRRLRGEMSKREFAVLDYHGIEIGDL